MGWSRGMGFITYHEQDDRIGPGRVHILYQVNVGVVVIPAGDFVRMAVVIAAHLDDHKFSWLLGLHVPVLRVVGVHGACARAWVRGAVPVPFLGGVVS